MVTISAASTVIGVIGDPIAHSLSPTIHNAALEAMRLDWVSVAFPVPAGHGAAALDAMRTLSIRGLSVTMPHKADALKACDRLDASAAKLGVINCVHNDAGTLVGYNTDGDGLVESVPVSFGRDVAGARVVVLGAGGAARSVIEALGRSGVDRLVVVNRTASRAQAAADLAPMATVSGIDAVRHADLVINTTSVGMGADPDDDNDSVFPCPPGLVAPDAMAIDLIYHPLQTPWLTRLSERGVRVTNGVDMLVAQAAIQLRHFTGMAPDVAAMRHAAERQLAQTAP